jgi:hypothetical protein
MFWVQRGEEVCRKRCADIQAALSGEGSFNKKYGAVFALIDSYTDEDSNVDLLNGKTLSTSGPVWVDDPTQIGQPNDVTVREEVQKHAISNSSAGSSGPQPQPSTASRDIGPAEKNEPRDEGVVDKAALIEANRQKALERKRQKLEAEAAKTQEAKLQEIFEAQQWLP